MRARLGVALATMLVVSACAADEVTVESPATTLATTTTTTAPTTTTTVEVVDEEEHDHDHDDDKDHDGEHPTAPADATEVSEPAPRLVVSDGADGSIRVIDLATEEQVTMLSVSEPARVYEVGRHVLAVQREMGRVDVLEGGAWSEPHGDHFHHFVADPAITEAGFDAEQPTHVVEHHGLVAVFNDGDGSVLVLDANHIGHSDALVAEIDSGAAHHGVAVAVDDVVLVTTPVDGEPLPDGVAVVDLASGEELARFGDCPGLHGEAAVEAGVVFGCADGVLILSPGASGWTSTKVAKPDGVGDEDRTGTLVAGHDEPYVIGNLGRSALVRVDVETGTATALPIPLPVASFAFDGEHGVILALTTDGSAHRVDPLTGEILQSLQLLDAFELPTGHGGPPMPAISAYGNRAYVTDPTGGRVFELGISDELRLARELAVGGSPAGLTVVGLAGSH
jgi:hypothetical protein